MRDISFMLQFAAKKPGGEGANNPHKKGGTQWGVFINSSQFLLCPTTDDNKCMMSDKIIIVVIVTMMTITQPRASCAHTGYAK